MPPKKRYRRYLEPGEPCRIPKQTVHNQRMRQGQQHHEDDGSTDSSENERESASNGTSSGPHDPAHLTSSANVTSSPSQNYRDEYFDCDETSEQSEAEAEDSAGLENDEVKDYFE
ncbi:hypothetical protein V5799_032079 [Amblyomma americanum]|uniref:Uncharacterized protein n=1 Tax=Amblyomma americanum TaxID=6943 RepID=A0AAQ4DS72_AMBAM